RREEADRLPEHLHMAQDFDPIGSRKFWLDTPFMWKFEPNSDLTDLNQARYYWFNVSSFVELSLLGLMDRGRPILEKWIGRMEVIPDSDPLPFEPSIGGYSMAGMNLVFEWQAALGFCKWLSRGDPAVDHFRRALEADWYCWTLLGPDEMAEQRIPLEDF